MLPEVKANYAEREEKYEETIPILNQGQGDYRRFNEMIITLHTVRKLEKIEKTLTVLKETFDDIDECEGEYVKQLLDPKIKQFLQLPETEAKGSGTTARNFSLFRN